MGKIFWKRIRFIPGYNPFLDYNPEFSCFPASKTDFERIVISLAGNESGLFSVKAVLSYLLARVIIRETVLQTDLEKLPKNYHWL